MDTDKKMDIHAYPCDPWLISWEGVADLLNDSPVSEAAGSGYPKRNTFDGAGTYAGVFAILRNWFSFLCPKLRTFAKRPALL